MEAARAAAAGAGKGPATEAESIRSTGGKTRPSWAPIPAAPATPNPSRKGARGDVAPVPAGGPGAALEKTGSMLGSSPLRVLPSKTAILPVNRDLMPRSTDEVERCSRTVYAANIDKKVDKNDVRAFFESLCGKVSRIRLLGDYAHSTRIAFVEFYQAEGALAALNCSGALLGSLPIRVSPSKTPVKVDGGGGGKGEAASDGRSSSAASLRSGHAPQPHPQPLAAALASLQAPGSPGLQGPEALQELPAAAGSPPPRVSGSGSGAAAQEEAAEVAGGLTAVLLPERLADPQVPLQPLQPHPVHAAQLPHHPQPAPAPAVPQLLPGPQRVVLQVGAGPGPGAGLGLGPAPGAGAQSPGRDAPSA